MNEAHCLTVFKTFQQQGITLAAGLSESQFTEIETRFGFRFPPDLRLFLSVAVPVGDDFPNWHHLHPRQHYRFFRWPAQGMYFDIFHNTFWLAEWGAKPTRLKAALRMAGHHLKAAPFLIPVFSHRYLPAEPCEAGNPVFSVYQTDVVHYGFDLPDYFENEFGIPNPFPKPESAKPVRFWDRIMNSWQDEIETE
ncbi:MAG: SMI1/KNR4 family protein [Blastocatellia bacterium]|nr:SMI1/KNR4 family protein [Blastocatellia bacterium]